MKPPARGAGRSPFAGVEIIENENGDDRAAADDRSRQGGVIREPEIATEPKQGKHGRALSATRRTRGSSSGQCCCTIGAGRHAAVPAQVIGPARLEGKDPRGRPRSLNKVQANLNRFWIFTHFRCGKILASERCLCNCRASEMRDNPVAIYLVGETIDAKRAHQRAQSGELIPLVRGVYVDRDGDAEAAILGHAVRIAHYLYPNAYLSSASAVLLAATPDGRLFISGRRNQRTRLRTLEIIQNEAPAHPSTAIAVIGDDLGELRVAASSPRQRFLEAFRLRSEHASAITADMRTQMASRLVAEHGTPQAAADAVWALARENGWYREGEGAERFLLAKPGGAAPVNKAALNLLVAWHGDLIGRLTHDGFEWRWKPERRSGPALIRETTPGKLPAFIEFLLPEGWLAQVLHDRDERDALRRGRRYMSNIAIVEDLEALATLPADVLMTALASFVTDGRFTGVYAGPGRGEIEETFEQNLARIFARAETPRLSGVQIKAPMSLTHDGALVPAIDQPFTHILKPAGTAGFDMLPIVEWLCLELGRAAGFETPDAALIAMPDGMPPAASCRTVRRQARGARSAPSRDGGLLLHPGSSDIGEI